MSRERIKKLKAVIKRLEAAIEPVNPVLAICKDETEEEVLKKYGFTAKDRDRIQWVRVFGSKKDEGPEDAISPINSGSERLKKLEEEIDSAVKDLKADGFSERDIQILVKEPIKAPRFLYRPPKENGESKADETETRKKET